MNTFIDIETIPKQPEAETKAEIAKTIKAPAQMKKPETIAAWHAGEGSYAGVKSAVIDDTYRKTSFDGAQGEICSIAYAFECNEPIGWCQDGDVDEKTLLLEFTDQLRADLKAGGGLPDFASAEFAGDVAVAMTSRRRLNLRSGNC